MFCTQCGASLPDDARFCTSCGADLSQEASDYSAQAVTYSAPVYEGRPASKKEYLASLATPKTKTAAKLLPIFVAVCVLVMVIGHICMLNASMEDIPVFAMIMEEEGIDDFDEVKDEMYDAIDEVEDLYDYYEDEIEDVLSDKEMKYIDQLFEDMENCAQTYSINNIKAMCETAEKISNTDAAEYMNLEDDFDELNEILEAFEIATTVALVLSILSLLFTIIGGLCRVGGLVIVGLIFSTIFCLVLYGALFVILNAAAHIALFVMIRNVNKEYKAYRKSFVAA